MIFVQRFQMFLVYFGHHSIHPIDEFVCFLLTHKTCQVLFRHQVFVLECLKFAFREFLVRIIEFGLKFVDKIGFVSICDLFLDALVSSVFLTIIWYDSLE